MNADENLKRITINIANSMAILKKSEQYSKQGSPPAYMPVTGSLGLQIFQML